jgi:L-serine dehydratase
MSEKSSIFDMIGPVMIGPSSSHTGGVVRIGRVARRLFGQKPDTVQITFYNSFARTYEGHGSDRAVVAGLLDMKTDDERIRKAFDFAKQSNLNFVMKAVLNASTLHPNSVRIQMESSERKMNVLGVSRGGGLIAIAEIDGYKCNFSAQLKALILKAEDVKGSVAFITSIIANEGCNIATMSVNRNAKHQTAMMVIEMDEPLRPLTIEYLKSLRWVNDVIYIPDIDL